MSLGNKNESFDLQLTYDDHQLGPGELRVLGPGMWFLLVVQGTLTARLPGWNRPLGEHSLLFLPLSRPQPLVSQEACRCLALQLDPEGFRALEGSLVLPAGQAAAGIFAAPGGYDLAQADAREAIRLLQSLPALGDSGRSCAPAFMAARLQELLLFYRQAREDHTRLESRIVWGIEDVVAWVDDNLAAEHSLADLVAKCALNTTDFSRLFKARTGYPLFEYINRRRIQRSCVLLRKSRLTILEIALEVGYNNISFYNRYFQRIMGTTPSDYRHQ